MTSIEPSKEKKKTWVQRKIPHWKGLVLFTVFSGLYCFYLLKLIEAVMFKNGLAVSGWMAAVMFLSFWMMNSWERNRLWREFEFWRFEAHRYRAMYETMQDGMRQEFGIDGHVEIKMIEKKPGKKKGKLPKYDEKVLDKELKKLYNNGDNLDARK